MPKEIIREREIIPDDTVTRSTATTAESPTSILAKVIYVIFSIIAALLALRFVLALLGANTANSIVGALYNITQPFVEPFENFFVTADSVATRSGFRFELETLVALVFIVVIAWILTQIIRMFDSRERV